MQIEFLFYHLKIILVAQVTGDISSTNRMNDYNVMIDGRTSFDKPVKNNLRTYDNNRKITTSQGDDYTTGCLLDYPY